MKEETKETIAAAYSRGEQYDESVAELFLNKEIVAPIIQMVVPEFQGMSVEDIIRHMETDIVKTDPVDDIPVKIEGMSTEMKSAHEKCIRYDIHFKMRNPVLSDETIAVRLHIDFEVQNEYKPTNPAYPIMKRAIFYAARELTSQLGRLTQATDYGKLEKVYSIWVCNQGVPEEEKDTVSLYSIHKKDLIGESMEDEEFYDLLSVIMIRRGSKVQKEDIFTYLQAVFSSDIDTMQRYSDVEWSEDLKEEAKTMSGLGMSIYEQGIEQGVEQGMEKGMKKERSAVIEKLLQKGKTAEEIADFLDYDLDEVKRIEENLCGLAF